MILDNKEHILICNSLEQLLSFNSAYLAERHEKFPFYTRGSKVESVVLAAFLPVSIAKRLFDIQAFEHLLFR